MITVIDNKKQKAYNCTTKTAVSRIIYVCVKTLERWSKTQQKVTYNNFDVYFNSELINKNV